MMKKILLIILLLALSNYCSASDNINDQSNKTTDEYHVIHGRSLIFFEFLNIIGPNGEELTDGAYEILDDFYWHAKNAAKLFQSNNLTVEFIKAKKIIYNKDKVIILDQKQNKCGLIIYNGNDKPKILYGIYTGPDYIKEVENYLKLKIKR